MIDEKKLIEDIISNDGIQFDMDFEIKPEHKFIKSLNRYTKLFRDGIINLINKQPKVFEWIHADDAYEEVPDSERNVLITREDTGEVVIGYYSYAYDTWFADGTHKEIPVAAWMELPEGYKKKGDKHD
jgi:hypothetical protein